MQQIRHDVGHFVHHFELFSSTTLPASRGGGGDFSPRKPCLKLPEQAFVAAVDITISDA